MLQYRKIKQGKLLCTKNQKPSPLDIEIIRKIEEAYYDNINGTL
jgi:hypothetical protein